jgi:hypothetical protein
MAKDLFSQSFRKNMCKPRANARIAIIFSKIFAKTKNLKKAFSKPAVRIKTALYQSLGEHLPKISKVNLVYRA